jgi:hypothetical protein
MNTRCTLAAQGVLSIPVTHTHTHTHTHKGLDDKGQSRESTIFSYKSTREDPG